MGEEKTQDLKSINTLVTNAEVAALFREMAGLLELQGLAQFKLRAYGRAAQSIESHPEPLVDLYRQGRLREVRGIGESFARKVTDIIETGTCPKLEELRRDYPPVVLELMRVPGVGPKTAVMVWRELAVSDLAELAEAARDGRLAELRGLGPKRAAAVLAGIESLRRWAGRTPIAVAKPLATAISRGLALDPDVARAEVAGSLRRGKELVGDLDVLVATAAPAAVLGRFAALPAVTEVLALGDTKASVRMKAVQQVDVRAVAPDQFAAALLYFTGSKEHNVRLREIAKEEGLKLSEYGLFDAAGRQSPVVASEAELYAALGLAYIPPELREDAGEIEAAAAGRLPRLIEAGDLRGDLHAHTRWTDGADDVTTMGEQAGVVGREYLAITDHSQALAFTGGLDAAKLRRQGEEIAAFNAAHPDGPRLLHGCEVEILPDGSLDLADEVLAGLDWVVAAVHSPNRRGGLDMTGRLLAAARHPLVDVIAHPTGQIIGVRDAYELDTGALLAAAAQSGVALEINASPHRLDLPPHLARQAAGLGIKLVISTDAHDSRGLADLDYGVIAARRGWLRAADVLNTLGLVDLTAWRQRRRRGG